nr:MAG TPA: hypothetical protein [Caudoviricetes sp.]
MARERFIVYHVLLGTWYMISFLSLDVFIFKSWCNCSIT